MSARGVRRIACVALAAALWICSAGAAAQGNPERIAPISSFVFGSSSLPERLVNAGGRLFFTTLSANGVDLWTSDGGVAGTVMLKTLCTGACNSFIGNPAAVGSVLYFTAADANGLELWKTDGTVAGTVLVKDIRPGGTSSIPQFLVNAGGTLFFAADNGVGGRELWKSDGTAAGTVQVADIAAGPASSNPGNLVDVNGTLFFIADDGVNGFELWKSNGTAAGTVLVKDIDPTPGQGSVPRCLANLNGTLLFYAAGGLWRSDGTNAGTTQEATIALGECPVVVPQLGYAFFTADAGVSLGEELWRTNGTNGGTFAMGDINPGPGSSSPRFIVPAANGVYFAADNGTQGQELWFSGGLPGNTFMVKDIVPGANGSFVRPLAMLGSTLMLIAYDDVHGDELWRSDGTPGGTVLVRDVNPGPEGLGSNLGTLPFAVSAGKLFFRALSNDSGYELWTTDGTGFGTRLVRDIAPGLDSTAGTVPMMWTGSELFFRGYSADAGLELWRTDGTPLGTRIVRDIRTGTADSEITTLGAIGGRALFAANDGVNGPQLWISDGSRDGTRLVRVLGNGVSVTRILSSGGRGFFALSDGISGLELWTSDGTDAGTYGLADICAGFCSGVQVPPALMLNGLLVFAADPGTGSTGTELWRSDGTPAGTFMLKDVQPGATGSNPQLFTRVGNTLFFVATTDAQGSELWKTDGTAAGTVLVKDILPGPSGSAPAFLTAVGNTLFFLADDGVHGVELWKSDGTAAGTVLVKDIRPGASFFFTDELAAVGNTLFFRVNDPATGLELWKSDGTDAGTVMVKDINPGSAHGQPQNLVALGGLLYFSADDGVHGLEPWRSDGTAAGTFMLVDLNPGPSSSAPTSFTPAGDRLFFAASDGVHEPSLFQFRVEAPVSGLRFSPAAVAFGNQGVQTSSAPQTVTLTNTTSPAAILSALGTTGDFNVVSSTCGGTLAPGASCTMTVVFRPVVAGARSGSVTAVVGSAAPATVSAALSGTGVVNATVTPTLAAGGTSTYGALVSFSASLPVATSGTVFFYDGGNFIGADTVACAVLPCTATFATRSLAVGAHSITAEFLGNATFPGGLSPAIAHNVGAAATSTLLVSSAPTAALNTPVAFTAAVATPGEIVTGSVAFTSDGSSIGGCTAVPVAADGTARCTVSNLAAGTHAIGARFGGDANNLASASNTVTQAVSAFVNALTPSEAVLDFGGQSINTTAPAIAVTLANTSGAALTVTSVIASAPFAVASHDCASLATSATCTARVSFTPGTQGTISGALTLATSAGSFTVTLAGIGERSLVTHYYRSILGRAPDAGGKAFWEGERMRVQGLGANVNETWFAMAQSFYASAEYAAFHRDDAGFVTDLYNTFFNRAPDGAGLAFWLANLSQGMPREVVLAEFMFSAEFAGFTQAIFGNTAARKEIDVVMDFYRGLLSRVPDDGGFGFWVQIFRTAQCNGSAAVTAQAESISSQFALSPEYAGRARTNAQYVGDLYNAFLRRGGDVGGVNFWINAVATGRLTREQLRQQFLASPEFQGRVQAVIAAGCAQ